MALLILDFDSTFIEVEALEELAAVSLANDPAQAKKITAIAALTDQAMKGELDFNHALQQRLDLLQADRSHLTELIRRLKRKITPSLLKSLRERESFWSDHRLFIVSGGFKDYIVPVVALCGIEEGDVFANDFRLNEDGRIIGYNADNPLARGKVEAARIIREQTNERPVVVLGDGWTDYEIKAQGLADRFFAFTANARRSQVVAQADGEATSAEDFIQLVNRILK